MPKFLADSFHAHSHLAIFKGLCIFNPSGTAEAMPKFSDDLFYVQVRPSTIQANYRPTTTHQLLKQLLINNPKHFPAIALGAGSDFLRVIHCPNSRLAPMTLMRNMASWLLVHLTIISRDDYVIMILLCCFDCSGRHIVPTVAVKSSCVQPAQKGRYLRISQG